MPFLRLTGILLLGISFFIAIINAYFCFPGIKKFFRHYFQYDSKKFNKIETILFIGVFGFIIAVAYHIISGVCFGLPWPHNSFLFDPRDRFADLYRAWIFGKHIAGENPYITSDCNYFPLFFLVMFPFSFLAWCKVLPVFFLVVVSTFILLVYKMIKNFANLSLVKKMGYVILLTVTSYPLLFLLDRGNSEGILFIFLCLFVYLYKKRKFLLSAIPLSFAIGMKLYPAVFLVLFISDRKYREFVWCILLTIGITALSLFLMSGGVISSLSGLVSNLNSFQETHVIAGGSSFYNHTLFNLLSHTLYRTAYLKEAFIHPYLVIAFILFVLTASYVILVEKEFWKKVTLLVLAMIVLPYVSYDYTLIHLYIPLVLFVNSGNKKSNRSIFVFSILFGLLIIPKNYIMGPISVGLLLNPTIMIAMAWIILKEGILEFREKSVQAG